MVELEEILKREKERERTPAEKEDLEFAQRQIHKNNPFIDQLPKATVENTTSFELLNQLTHTDLLKIVSWREQTTRALEKESKERRKDLPRVSALLEEVKIRQAKTGALQARLDKQEAGLEEREAALSEEKRPLKDIVRAEFAAAVQAERQEWEETVEQWRRKLERISSQKSKMESQLEQVLQALAELKEIVAVPPELEEPEAKEAEPATEPEQKPEAVEAQAVKKENKEQEEDSNGKEFTISTQKKQVG